MTGVRRRAHPARSAALTAAGAVSEPDVYVRQSVRLGAKRPLKAAAARLCRAAGKPWTGRGEQEHVGLNWLPVHKRLTGLNPEARILPCFEPLIWEKRPFQTSHEYFAYPFCGVLYHRASDRSAAIPPVILQV